MRKGAEVWRWARLAVLLAGALAGCSAKIPVYIDAGSQRSFAGYRTYGWANPPAEPRANQDETTVEVFGWTARNAVDAALQARGWLRDDRSPDLTIVLRTTVEETYSDTLGEYFRYRDAGGTQTLFAAFSLGYERADLIVEAYDRSGRQLLWRGRTVVAMDAPERSDRAATSLRTLLAAFPPADRPGAPAAAQTSMVAPHPFTSAPPHLSTSARILFSRPEPA